MTRAPPNKVAPPEVEADHMKGRAVRHWEGAFCLAALCRNGGSYAEGQGAQSASEAGSSVPRADLGGSGNGGEPEAVVVRPAAACLAPRWRRRRSARWSASPGRRTVRSRCVPALL